ncbi:hypothetical protein [Candidimonas nitroreducens]|uniref:Uncharacterized protein n=1 Tax=Candidimonas nitroreducens TaxID=683354 RepID=A0A225M4V3_9BURK|nr:hypothetical protein [Candidimonas nitroreducens]OWT55273.1 hypothetical protein CEY11_21425 [Candidimonas nitroreducens]
MTQLFSDAARTTLAADITSTATSLTLTDSGSVFPTISTGDMFKIVLQDDDGFEIAYVTTHSSGSTTLAGISRGQEGTTAKAFSAPTESTAGTTVGLRVTAQDMEAFRDKVDADNGLAQAMRFNVSALGNVSGSQTIDLSSATEFTMTVTGDTTFAFSNAPASGESQVVYLRIEDGGAHTVAWPSGTQFDDSGTAPELTSSGVDLLGVKRDSTTSTNMIFVLGQAIA